MRNSIVVGLVALSLTSAGVTAGAVPIDAGFAKADVTPAEPVRLSGYANRTQPFEGIDMPLFVRAMALRPQGGETFVLVSLDTIGTPAAFTDEVAGRLNEKFGIARERFVLAGTHSHTSPHLAAGLSNLFSTPLTEAETKATEAYAATVKDAIVSVVDKAIADLKPARWVPPPGVLMLFANTNTFSW